MFNFKCNIFFKYIFVQSDFTFCNYPFDYSNDINVGIKVSDNFRQMNRYKK